MFTLPFLALPGPRSCSSIRPFLLPCVLHPDGKCCGRIEERSCFCPLALFSRSRSLISSHLIFLFLFCSGVSLVMDFPPSNNCLFYLFNIHLRERRDQGNRSKEGGTGQLACEIVNAWRRGAVRRKLRPSSLSCSLISYIHHDASLKGNHLFILSLWSSKSISVVYEGRRRIGRSMSPAG